MAPKRKAADDEENDSNDSFGKFFLFILKFLCHSSAITAPFIKLSHQRDDVRPGLTQCFLCFFQVLLQFKYIVSEESIGVQKLANASSSSFAKSCTV